MRVLLDRRPLLDVSVRRTNSSIPHALEAIVGKCLVVSTDDRYADAGALADDLGRFLEHRRLAHAVNPSRRERCVNWGVRNRSRLAVAACLLPLAFLLGVVAERSMMSRRPLRPIESSPDLKAAVASLDRGDAEESLEPLVRLKGEYGQSSVPRVYLGFAYQADGLVLQAERSFAEVLSMRNARQDLLAWAPADPKLPARLDQFAERRIERASYIDQDRERAEVDRKRDRDHQYTLARRASEIASEIRKAQPRSAPIQESLPTKRSSGVHSGSDLTEYNLARSEQELGDYESVLHRVDRAIKSIGSHRPSDPADEFDDLRRLYDWRLLGCRARTMWAERFRDGGSQSSLLTARDHLQLAERDLQLCTYYVENRTRNQKESHQVEQVRVQAMMTRVEIDLGLGNVQAAIGHLARACAALQKYDEIATLVDKRKQLESSYQRFNEIDARLRKEQAKKSVPAPAGTAEVTANDSSRGH